MKLNENFTRCEIAGEAYIVPVGSEVVNVESMMQISETADVIIKRLQESEAERDELVDLLFDEYEVDRQVLEKDLDDFIQEGKRIGFII